MGLIEEMMGSLSGADEAMHPSLMQALQGLIGNEEQPGVGLQGVVDGLRAQGHGGIVDTWTSPATNLPVTPDQVREAIGAEEARAAAARAGLPEETFLSTIAEHLPGLVDRLSPDGNLLPAQAHATSLGI